MHNPCGILANRARKHEASGVGCGRVQATSQGVMGPKPYPAQSAAPNQRFVWSTGGTRQSHGTLPCVDQPVADAVEREERKLSSHCNGCKATPVLSLRDFGELRRKARSNGCMMWSSSSHIAGGHGAEALPSTRCCPHLRFVCLEGLIRASETPPSSLRLTV